MGLKSANEIFLKDGQPKSKYEIPRTKLQERSFEKNRSNTAKKFCKYDKVNMPKPVSSRKIDKNVCSFYKDQICL